MTTQTITLRLVGENGQLIGTLATTKKELKSLGEATAAESDKATKGARAAGKEQAAAAQTLAKEQAAAAKSAAAAAKAAAREQAAAARAAAKEQAAAAKSAAAASQAAAREQAAAARAAAREQASAAAQLLAKEEALAAKSASAAVEAAAREQAAIARVAAREQAAAARTAAREQVAAAKAATAAAEAAAKEQAAAARAAAREQAAAARSVAKEQAAAASAAAASARASAAEQAAAAKSAAVAARSAAREQAEATRLQARALNEYGITAGQQKQALRQLPAQITDIVTSLIGGQPVYQVAIQQGGQLRDSFGGIGGAAKALVGALNPVTIVLIAAAAAIGGVAFQALQGYKELREFDRAILSSGNAAGATAGELADLADSIGKATGRFGDARDAVRELAASGQITGETLARAGRAAVALAALTGSSVAEATQKIVDLAKTPSEALLKLNQQYNFLTPATYRQVQALEEQGRLTDAARIAIDAFGEAQEKRLAEAESRAGSLERAYEGVRRAIVGLFEGLRDVGRTDNEFLLREAQERLREAELSAARFAKDTGSRPESASANPSVVQAREEVRRLEELIRGTKEKAEAEAKAAADNAKELAADQARKQAQASLDRLRISNLNKQQSLEREIAEIRELSAKAGAKQADIERDVAHDLATHTHKVKAGSTSDAHVHHGYTRVASNTTVAFD